MIYKNFLKGLAIFTSIILVASLIMTILYDKDILTYKSVSIVEFLSLTVATFITGFYLGLKSSNKAYISGLALGGIITVASLILSLLTAQKIGIISLVTYLFIIVVATASSILGINQKK